MKDRIRDQAQPLRDRVENRAENSRNLTQQNEKQQRPGSVKVITVASGKGGVGKTSISVNLAIALSMLGQRILVVDADFGLANVDVMLGVSARYNLGHLLRGEKNLYEIIQEGYAGVRFISGGSGVYELLEMDEFQLKIIMHNLLRLRNPADIILFDAGAGINENVIQLMLASSEIVVVATPEPTAILDAYALVKTISKRDGTRNIRLIMNKSENKREAEIAIEGFCEVVKKHLGVKIESLGYVLYDHDVVNSIKRQTPVMISHPNGPTATDIEKIAKNLLNISSEPATEGKLAKFFSRFLG